MPTPLPPCKALLEPGVPLPLIPTCEHYAGTEKFIKKAFELQGSLGPIFDITCDCEDGAVAGQELEHCRLICDLIASRPKTLGRVGIRVHGPNNSIWKQEINTVFDTVGDRIAYVTIPKLRNFEEASAVSQYLKLRSSFADLKKLPALHILIENQSALRDVWKIAAIPGLEVLDFGLLDFISDHHGAIPESCMRSPGQFEHRLLVRAKTEIVAAALSHGVLPSHNVSIDLSAEAQTRTDASKARNEFGFLRMWSIHPKQIKPIVEAMDFDFSKLELATSILSQAYANNWAPIRFNEELYDRASYRHYWHMLQRARAQGLSLSPAAQKLFIEE